VFNIKFIGLLSIALVLGACTFEEPAPPTSTSQPPKTNTPIPSSTATAIPPTETQMPTPTIPPNLWLDSRQYELTVQHPASTAQPGWGTANEIIIPADGMVGGVVFTVEEFSDKWGSTFSLGVAPENSLLKSVSSASNPPGLYCVSDYFPGFSPAEVCEILAPGATRLDWSAYHFAGPKTEVGVSFGVGSCHPASCTAFLRITNIRLIYYSVPE